jgi:tetratricopeptide (TPR) repeat protein
MADADERADPAKRGAGETSRAARELVESEKGSGASPADVTEVLQGSSRARVPALEQAPENVSPPAPALAAGVMVGRYRVLDLVGSGGMGSVYRAHDPDLSRDIALKVLHPRLTSERRGSDYRQRLLREAQTLAKLSHPNVVAAFDVGSVEDVVFVAMELVPGESLRSWLREARSVNAVARVLIAAGRGLVAAHEAGVLHRDFKPANIMVSPDGRVRVVDFGLARSAVASATAASPRVDRPGAPASLDAALTDTGVLLGTPGYICPEQLNGEPADELGDQYSFAVTAFVALARREPPAEGARDAATRESLSWPRHVPRRVRRVVERGLASRPEERYPNLAAMVDALEEAIAPRRRTAALVGLTLGALSIAATSVLWQANRSHVTCQVDAESFRSVWDAERRATLRDALTSTGRANADDAFRMLAARLDVYQRDWLAMRQARCEATHVRGELSERALSLSNACLERKRADVGALVSAFSRPSPGVVDRAASAAPAPLAECADTPALLGTADKLPADPAARAAIERVEAGFPMARALRLAGHWQEAGDNAEKLLQEARAVGHASTTAAALRNAAITVSSRARTVEERRRGEDYLREAIPLAAQAGDARAVASIAGDLFELVAWVNNKTEEAEAMMPQVEALVLLAGDPPEARIGLTIGQAKILANRGKYREAIELYQRVIDLSRGLYEQGKGYGAKAESEIGSIYIKLEDHVESVRHMQAGLAGLERMYGSRHPRMMIGLANLALAQSKVDTRAARDTIAKMRELEAILPAGEWRTLTIPFLEGQVREDSGDCANALPFYQSALEAFTQTYGAESAKTADVYARLGACRLAIGQRSQGLADLERALALRRATGAAANEVAAATFELAVALDAGTKGTERARGLALAREARELWRRDGVVDKLKTVESWITGRESVGQATL